MYCPRTTSAGSIGSMLRKTLFFSSLIGVGSSAVGGSIAMNAEDLEQVGHHHVAIGAGGS
jgi:hypothetical protein